MKEFLNKNFYIIGLIIIGVILIGYIYLDNTKQGHDLLFHIANIHNIVSNNLKVTPVMPNLAHNLGYGIYIFYPIATHFIYAIITALLKIFGLKTINCVLIINILVSILSSIFMYKLVLEIAKNKKVAFISGIIYMLLPYRLGLITVRMALAENFAGLFIPCVLLRNILFI